MTPDSRKRILLALFGHFEAFFVNFSPFLVVWQTFRALGGHRSGFRVSQGYHCVPHVILSKKSIFWRRSGTYEGHRTCCKTENLLKVSIFLVLNWKWYWRYNKCFRVILDQKLEFLGFQGGRMADSKFWENGFFQYLFLQTFASSKVLS